MAKREVLSFIIPKPKRRIPELFSDDTPFKPKIVGRKDQYTRKPKYVKRGFDDSQ